MIRSVGQVYEKIEPGSPSSCAIGHARRVSFSDDKPQIIWDLPARASASDRREDAEEEVLEEDASDDKVLGEPQSRPELENDKGPER
jgi:hypothetical protein